MANIVVDVVTNKIKANELYVNAVCVVLCFAPTTIFACFYRLLLYFLGVKKSFQGKNWTFLQKKYFGWHQFSSKWQQSLLCGSEREICRQRSFRHLFQMTQTRKMSLGFWLQRFSKYFCGTFTLAFSKSNRSQMEETIACGIGVKFSSICLCYLADFFLRFQKEKYAAYLR